MYRINARILPLPLQEAPAHSHSHLAGLALCVVSCRSFMQLCASQIKQYLPEKARQTVGICVPVKSSNAYLKRPDRPLGSVCQSNQAIPT